MFALKEIRHMIHEVRSEGEDEKKAAGIGIIYDEWQEIWPGCMERISKGAVKKGAEVKSFFNHEPSQVLSTTSSNPPLKLKNTDKGLEYVSPIPPTSYGKDLEINLERGNVKGSSFAFSVPKDGVKAWEEKGIYYRDITKLNLFEIGPVTDPAYISTSANLRSAEDVYNKLVSERQEAKDAEDNLEKTKLEQEFQARLRALQILEKELK